MKKYVFHLCAFLTVCIWGTTFVSTKLLLTQGLSPSDILFYRFTLAYLLIWFVCPKKLFAQNLKDELMLLGAGLCGGSLYFLTENTALRYTLASNVSFILCSAPLLTAFILRLFHQKEKLGMRYLAGTLLALCGVALIVFNGQLLKVNPLGDFLCILGALSWAFYSLFTKKLENKYPVMFIIRKVFFYGLLTISPVFLYRPLCTDLHILFRPLVLGNLLYLGIIASLLCYIMWNLSMKKLGAIVTTDYIYLSPVVTAVTSYLVLDEIFTRVAFLGAICILAGVICANRRPTSTSA